MEKEQKNAALAETYWTQSGMDLKEAKKSLKNQEHTKCAMLSVQAAMNAMTAICIANRRYQNPTFSLTELARVCAGYDENLKEIREVCLDMDEIQNRTPFEDAKNQGEPVDAKLAVSFPGQAEEIRKACQKSIRKNQYFPISRFSF